MNDNDGAHHHKAIHSSTSDTTQGIGAALNCHALHPDSRYEHAVLSFPLRLHIDALRMCCHAFELLVLLSNPEHQS